MSTEILRCMPPYHYWCRPCALERQGIIDDVSSKELAEGSTLGAFSLAFYQVSLKPCNWQLKWFYFWYEGFHFKLGKNAAVIMLQCFCCHFLKFSELGQ